MKKKIIGIVILMLLITPTVLTAAINTNDSKSIIIVEENIENNTQSSTQNPYPDDWSLLRYDIESTGYNPYSINVPSDPDCIEAARKPFPGTEPEHIGIITPASVIVDGTDKYIYFCDQSEPQGSRLLRKIRYEKASSTNPTPSFHEESDYPTNCDDWWWRSAPTIDRDIDRLYVGLYNSTVQEGLLRIDLDLTQGMEEFYNIVEVQSPPMIVEDVYGDKRVIVGTNNSDEIDDKIYCFNDSKPASDPPIWQYPVGGAVFCAAAVDLTRGYVVIGCDDGKLYCFDLYSEGTATVIWTFDTAVHPGGFGEIQGSPCIDKDDGHVYISCWNGWVYCLDIDGILDQTQGTQYGDSDLLWGTELYSSRIKAYSCAVANERDRLYVVVADINKLFCLNTSNGDILWEFDATGYVDPGFILQNSVSLVNGQVIIAGGIPIEYGPGKGRIFCLDENPDNDGDGDFNEDPVNGADDDMDGLTDEDPDFGLPNSGDYDIIWKWETTAHSGYGRISAYPVIVDGSLFIGDFEGYMYAIGGPNILIRDHDQDVGITPSFDINRNWIYDGPPEYSYRASPDIMIDRQRFRPPTASFPLRSEMPAPGRNNRIWIRFNNTGHAPAWTFYYIVYANEYNYGMNLPYDLGSPIAAGTVTGPIYPGDFWEEIVGWNTPNKKARWCILVCIACVNDPYLWTSRPEWDNNVACRIARSNFLGPGSKSEDYWRADVQEGIQNSESSIKNYTLHVLSEFIPPEWEIVAHILDKTYELETGYITIPILNLQVDEIRYLNITAKAPLDTEYLNTTIEMWLTEGDRLLGGGTSDFIIDKTPPTVEEIKPGGYLYLFDKEIMPFGIPLIIGSITVEADVDDLDSGMERVEFYIDDELKENVTTYPFEWEWSERAFGRKTVKIVAYDSIGNNVVKEIKVLKFF